MASYYEKSSIPKNSSVRSRLPKETKQNPASVDEIRKLDQSNILKASYTWTINNFTERFITSSENVTSPVFKAGPSDEVQWNLYLEVADQEYLLVHACSSHGSATPNTQIDYDISILDYKGREILEEAILFVSGRQEGLIAIIRKNALRYNTRDYLPNNKLTILCKITAKVEPPKSKLSEDIGELLVNEMFSDVILKTSHKEFRVHKAILSSRSAVFQAMFNHNMLENRMNHVEIEDVDDDILEEMLRFMYTGKVNNLEEVAFSLLSAADKYAIDELKTICERSLCSNLTVENVVDIFVLADLLNIDNLQKKALEFSLRHVKEVTHSEGFKTHLPDKLLQKLCLQ